MKKMKKTFALAIAAMFVLAIALSGCGSGSQTSTTAPAETSAPAATQATEAPSAPASLTWYLVGPRQEPDTDKIEAEASKYMKEKLNLDYTIDLTVLGYGDPYNQKVNTMLAAGDPFDICFTAGWAADIKTNSTSGYFKALDDYLAKDPTITDIVGSDFLNATKIGGHFYAVPCHKEMVHNWGYIVQQKYIEKYSLDPTSITKMEDMEPFFDKILAGEPGITPIASSEMENPYRFLDWDVFGDNDAPGALYPNNNNTTVINQWIAPETVTFYKKMREYNQKGYLAKDAATAVNFNDLISSGKYAACEQSLKPGKDKEMKGSTGGIDWVQIDITKPVMSNNDISGGALLAIPAASKNPDQAFKFITLLYTDKFLNNLFVYGIENTHYKKVADNSVTLEGGESSGYAAGNGWRFGDQFLNYIIDGLEAPDKWEQFKKFNESATALNSCGFAYDKTAVENEYAACKAVVQTYYKQLLAGAVADIDGTVNKMKNELTQSGVDKVIADMQKQYDAWRAANGK